MLEAEFELSCAHCGGQQFQEIFPVPAETYRFYGAGMARGESRQLLAAVYACVQCGHLEKFVEVDQLPGGRRQAAASGGQVGSEPDL